MRGTHKLIPGKSAHWRYYKYFRKIWEHDRNSWISGGDVERMVVKSDCADNPSVVRKRLRELANPSYWDDWKAKLEKKRDNINGKSLVFYRYKDPSQEDEKGAEWDRIIAQLSREYA